MLDINKSINDPKLANQDPEGYMYDLPPWNSEIAQHHAKKEGLGELSDMQWRVIHSLRMMQAVYPDDRETLRGWLDGAGLLLPQETFTLLDRMNRLIAGQFFYQMREAPGVQSPALTLALNSGSCRDFAALFMETCRYLGLASRFVSGYLFTSDFDTGNGSTHAWAEVYLPGAGWKGFDPTSGDVVGNRHIATAVARHPESVPPVAGSFIGPGGSHPVPNVTVRVSTLAT